MKLHWGRHRREKGGSKESVGDPKSGLPKIELIVNKVWGEKSGLGDKNQLITRKMGNKPSYTRERVRQMLCANNEGWDRVCWRKELFWKRRREGSWKKGTKIGRHLKAPPRDRGFFANFDAGHAKPNRSREPLSGGIPGERKGRLHSSLSGGFPDFKGSNPERTLGTFEGGDLYERLAYS